MITHIAGDQPSGTHVTGFTGFTASVLHHARRTIPRRNRSRDPTAPRSALARRPDRRALRPPCHRAVRVLPRPARRCRLRRRRAGGRPRRRHGRRTRRVPRSTHWPAVRSTSATSSTPRRPPAPTRRPPSSSGSCATCARTSARSCTCPACARWTPPSSPGCSTWPADTADELTVSACRRFAQSLSLALASARVPDHLADVFGAMSVAPIRDVLTRAPWAIPPVGLRAALLGPPGRPATAARRAPSPLVKQLWPTTPAWPLPLAETGAARPGSPHRAVFRTGLPAGPLSGPVLPANRSPDPFSPPDPEVVSAHEAATAPMPKLRDSVLTALDDAGARVSRLRLQRPKPRRRHRCRRRPRRTCSTTPRRRTCSGRSPPRRG